MRGVVNVSSPTVNIWEQVTETLGENVQSAGGRRGEGAVRPESMATFEKQKVTARGTH